MSSRTPSPVRNVHYHHKLQQELQQLISQPKLIPNLGPRPDPASQLSRLPDPWTNPKLCNILAETQQNFIKFET